MDGAIDCDPSGPGFISTNTLIFFPLGHQVEGIEWKHKIKTYILSCFNVD